MTWLRADLLLAAPGPAGSAVRTVSSAHPSGPGRPPAGVDAMRHPAAVHGRAARSFQTSGPSDGPAPGHRPGAGAWQSTTPGARPTRQGAVRHARPRGPARATGHRHQTGTSTATVGTPLETKDLAVAQTPRRPVALLASAAAAGQGPHGVDGLPGQGRGQGCGGLALVGHGDLLMPQYAGPVMHRRAAGRVGPVAAAYRAAANTCPAASASRHRQAAVMGHAAQALLPGPVPRGVP